MSPPQVVKETVDDPFENGAAPKSVEQKTQPLKEQKRAARSTSQYERNYKPTDLTIKQIRDAIPARLFARNTTRSMMYLTRDVFLVATIFYGATWSDTKIQSPVLGAVAWVIYWSIQGTVLVGLWVLGHECGHEAFSDRKLINTVVGWTLHSALLIPFHAWQRSHSKHHKNTGLITRPITNPALTRSELGLPPLVKKSMEKNVALHDEGADTDFANLDFEQNQDEEHHHHNGKMNHTHEESIFQDAPLYSLITILFALTFGWPLFLIMNFGGPASHRWISHYRPKAPLFDPADNRLFFYSNCGVAAMASILVFFAMKTSCWTVMKYYGIPYLIANGWMVCYDYLQHTDPNVPLYRSPAWNFQRGASATTDRSSGRLIDNLHHHMSSSHVCHHMFSRMPFYHAVEATPYLREVMGEYFLEDRTTPIFVALYRNWRACRFVEDEGDIIFYKH